MPKNKKRTKQYNPYKHALRAKSGGRIEVPAELAAAKACTEFVSFETSQEVSKPLKEAADHLKSNQFTADDYYWTLRRGLICKYLYECTLKDVHIRTQDDSTELLFRIQLVDYQKEVESALRVLQSLFDYYIKNNRWVANIEEMVLISKLPLLMDKILDCTTIGTLTSAGLLAEKHFEKQYLQLPKEHKRRWLEDSPRLREVMTYAYTQIPYIAR